MAAVGLCVVVLGVLVAGVLTRDDSGKSANTTPPVSVGVTQTTTTVEGRTVTQTAPPATVTGEVTVTGSTADHDEDDAGDADHHDPDDDGLLRHLDVDDAQSLRRAAGRARAAGPARMRGAPDGRCGGAATRGAECGTGITRSG